jgi:hypothetical protein
MLVSGIKSRPVYPGLKPDAHAKHNLILVEGEGAAAVLDLLAKAPEGFAQRSTVLFTPASAAGKDYGSKLEAAGTANYLTFPSAQTLLFRVGGMLPNMTMGTRIYVSGTETFIGNTIQLAGQHGVNHQSIISEHRGSEARRVQCVHCKGFTENVTTNPCVCAHCGLNLLVRDHYSRRHSAFQGVCIDAEVPGQVPAQEVIFK